MTNPKISKPDIADPSSGIIQAWEQLDVKKLSYIQLRRLYAVLMDAVDQLAGDIEARKEDDNAGDTVRVPVPPAG
ncbi:MAG: hypothetical protein ACE5OQ_01925 [Woeseia sp.]